MKLSIRLLSLVLLVGLFVFGCIRPGGQDQDQIREITVDSLSVTDIPYDSGDGLIVSWKPLPKESRIQEYRIYRGVHPDTLFFLASVQVNVKTGVAADMMYYYDSGYNTMVDLDSPGKLKHEKGNKDSIIYRGVPRDTELMARLSEEFNLYSSMLDKYYYYRSIPARSANEEDDDIYAGIKFNQQSILASLKTPRPGEEPTQYYYTVVPVNERNQYLGISEPVNGYPVDDHPEASPGFYSVALEDMRDLHFEWEYPIYHSDIAAYTIYMLPAIPDEQWEQMSDDEKDVTAAGGIPITQGSVGGGSLANYCVISEEELPAGLTWENVLGSRFTIVFQDYGSPRPSLPSNLATPALKNTDDLPKRADYRVEDKPMDKGDRIAVTWEKPIVAITLTTNLNSDGTKLQVNYQVNKTDAQDLSNIYFDFYEPGHEEPFAQIDEFYQDNIIRVVIPEEYSIRNKDVIPSDSLKIRITIASKPYELDPDNGRVTYGKKRLVENYETIQYIKPDPKMMAYMPTRSLIVNGQDVSTFQNVVYRKGYRSNSFTMVKRNTAYENNLDASVSYISSIGKPVLGFNFVKDGVLHTYMNGERYTRELKPGEHARNLTLLPSEIDFTYDKETETLINASIYVKEAKQEFEKLQNDLAETKAELEAKLESLEQADPAAAPALQAEIESLRGSIESQEKNLNVREENEKYQRSLKFSQNDNRMRYIAKTREAELRKHAYMLVKTNGEGMFTVSEPKTTESGDLKYFTPISNWFDWNKLITLIAVILFGISVVVFVNLAKKGKDLYIRPIAGLHEIDNAIGRATEMGRPMLYCMGNGGLSDVATLASLGILSLVAKKAAEYDTRLIVPCYDYIVMPIAQEIVREAHYAVGRPDSFDKNNVFYLTSVQFAYVAGVNGIMIRERMATNFFMGYFAAEALLMTETGNAVGAVQIAGSDAITQIPFFITTCDYTLIGEELYAASAYLNREPMLLGTLKGQDYFKLMIVVIVSIGAILASFQITGITDLFPLK